MAKPDHSLDPLILQSAKKEFLENGFEKASLKAICDGAGVTTGALYKRYSGKEALFSAVVDETVADLYEVYSQKAVEDFSQMTDDMLVKAWDMDKDYMMWWFQFLFDRYEGFVLLLKCAGGTRYSQFQHDWVEKMTGASYRYYQETYRRGLCGEEISEGEMHILLSSFWTTIYEPFIHGYQWEQLEGHCKLVCRMFDWFSTLGFSEEALRHAGIERQK